MDSIRTRPWRFPLALALAQTLASATVPAAELGQERIVDLELVLAVDASSSVSVAEFDLQIRGLAEAFRHPSVARAIRATGSELAEDNSVRLTASSLPPDEFGYFLVSRTQSFINPPSSNGILCLGGDIGRYNCVPCGQVQSSGSSGSMSIGRVQGLTLGELPLNVPPLFTSPGDTLNFQAWYRDAGGTNNFTDAVSVLFQ